MTCKLNIPCHWDYELFSKLELKNSAKDVYVSETYGVVPLGALYHGRSPQKLPSVEIDTAIRYRAFVKERGIDFLYLLNMPTTTITDSATVLETRVREIVELFNPDAFVVASPTLMNVIKHSVAVPIHISTIARVFKPSELEQFASYNPRRVVLQHDANRDFEGLERLQTYASARGIELEVMLTESCLRRCPMMIEHYETCGRGLDDSAFHVWCNSKKVGKPEEILMANFIRPEDMIIYENIGISRFKITGRSKQMQWLPEVVNAYLAREYFGNLIRLLGIDPNLNAETFIYVNNKALDGFLDGFPQSGVESEKEYCRQWCKKLERAGNLTIKEGLVQLVGYKNGK